MKQKYFIHILCGLLIVTFFMVPKKLDSESLYGVANGQLQVIKNLNKKIVLGGRNLNGTFVVVKAGKGYKDIKLESKCANSQKVAYVEKGGKDYNYYIININFTYAECNDNNVYIKSSDRIYSDALYKLDIVPSVKFYENFLDYSTSDIVFRARENIVELEKKLKNLAELRRKKDFVSKLKFIQIAYDYNYTDFEGENYKNILYGRDGLKYTSPVSGRSLPTNDKIIPNAKRSYRAGVTDGIHHGWDVFTSYGTPVVSIGEGVIIRIKDGFERKDFRKIKNKNVTDDDKLTNLDIYRGNQVWLKTIDGNVTFYSHLSKIDSDIYIGKRVQAGEVLGYVGKSGIPDAEYTNYHLHFEIQLNPLNPTTSGFTNLDIMRWSWFGKGEKLQQLLQNQSKAFK